MISPREARSIIRKAKRRVPHGEDVSHLNITAMMDMMTIIVVFLIKSVAVNNPPPTDIQLPHVSGLDLIRMLRKDKKLAQVPIMAVTAYSARGDEERIRAAGAQAYVSKPISVARFAQTVDDLLKESGTDTELANESADGPGLGEPGGEEI